MNELPEVHPFDKWLDDTRPAWRSKNQGSVHYYAMKAAWLQGREQGLEDAVKAAKEELREQGANSACMVTIEVARAIRSLKLGAKP